jgi:hypothetical protein
VTVLLASSYKTHTAGCLSRILRMHPNDTIQINQIPWKLLVQVKSCSDVIGLNSDGTSNVFVQLSLIHSRHHSIIYETLSTDVVYTTNHPKYIHDSHEFGNILDLRNHIRTTTLLITIFHQFSNTNTTKAIGQVKIPLSSLPWTGKKSESWYLLQAIEALDHVTGKVRLSLLLAGPPTTGNSFLI